MKKGVFFNERANLLQLITYWNSKPFFHNRIFIKKTLIIGKFFFKWKILECLPNFGKQSPTSLCWRLE
jgi:hypothetical protein